MTKRHLQPLTPAALYARVSSDWQDVAREYVDEAESGRVADRPQFREVIEEGASRRCRGPRGWAAPIC